MDYRVDVRLRNNRLLSAIEEKGYDSVAEFCREFDLSYTHLGDIIRIRKPALTRKGLYKGVVQRAADALGVNPEDLFTDTQAQANIQPRVTRTLSEADALSLASPEARGLIADDSEYGLQAAVDIPRLLTSLSDRHRRVIELRWGLRGNPPMTCKEVAAEMGRSTARIQKIEQRAMEKLQSAARVRKARAA